MSVGGNGRVRGDVQLGCRCVPCGVYCAQVVWPIPHGVCEVGYTFRPEIALIEEELRFGVRLWSAACVGFGSPYHDWNATVVWALGVHPATCVQR
eukprot:365590-Chlamydomonas_euryale.AAC.11